MIRKIRIEEAIGMPLAHSVTKVVPGKLKKPAFERGHVIEKEDVPEFLRIGKEHIYVLKLVKGEIHEEEAALSFIITSSGSPSRHRGIGPGRRGTSLRAYGDSPPRRRDRPPSSPSFAG